VAQGLQIGTDLTGVDLTQLLTRLAGAAKERADGTAVTASATPARAGNGTRTTRAVTAKAAPKQAEPPAETSD
jgi:hypothetical protein